MTLLRRLWKDEEGQDLVEYTLLVLFVTLASAVLMLGDGGAIAEIWHKNTNNLNDANDFINR